MPMTTAPPAPFCLCLASLFSDQPLSSTRLVVLVTGSESVCSACATFWIRMTPRAGSSSDFDGVGADAPLRVLSKEGGPLSSPEGR